MYFAIWALIVGALLITMALSGTWLRRLPVSTAMLYLAAGFGLGPAGLALMAPEARLPTASTRSRYRPSTCDGASAFYLSATVPPSKSKIRKIRKLSLAVQVHDTTERPTGCRS